RFTPEAPSEYRIRKEPQVDYLSTVESVAHVLEQLEPNTPGVGTLRESFRAMIDRAVEARRCAPDAGRGKRPRAPLPRPDAPVLVHPEKRLVVVYAEAAAAGLGRGHDPLIVTARRQGQPPGDALRLLLRTPTPPHPRLLGH